MRVNYSWKTKSLKAMLSTINATGKTINKYSPPKKLNDQILIDAAVSKAGGLRDFGPGRHLEALNQLVTSIEEEANLSFTGRLMAKESIINVLKFRLQFENYWKNNLELQSVEIKPPLFIAGLPRTGTTILYNLLAQDKKFRAPLCWECMSPVPKPGLNILEDEKRIKTAEKFFNFFYVLCPEMLTMHEVRPSWPQECNFIHEYEFMTINFISQYHIPSYQKWLSEQNFIDPFVFHKRFLQYLQGSSDTTWVLKSPGHLGIIEDLFKVYPDARIIQTHRDPVESIPSMASLTGFARKVYSDAKESCDPKFVGRDMKSYYLNHLKKIVEFRNSNEDKSRQFYDLSYAGFISNPIGEIEKIYNYFGIPLTDEALNSMRSFLNNNSQNKHGKHVYKLESFGYDTEMFQQEFKFYCDRFGV